MYRMLIHTILYLQRGDGLPFDAIFSQMGHLDHRDKSKVKRYMKRNIGKWWGYHEDTQCYCTICAFETALQRMKVGVRMRRASDTSYSCCCIYKDRIVRCDYRYPIGKRNMPRTAVFTSEELLAHDWADVPSRKR